MLGLISVALAFFTFACGGGGGGGGSTVNQNNVNLLDSKGESLSELAPSDSMGLEMTGLKPRTQYEINIVKASTGESVSYSKLTTDKNGEIPFTLLTYDLAPGKYRMQFTGSDLVKEFTVDSQPKSPLIVPCDSAGNYFNNYKIGDQIYVMGGGFNPNQEFDLFVVLDQAVWSNGDILTDLSEGPDKITASADGTVPVTLVWDGAKRAEYDPNPDGGQPPYPRTSQAAGQETANNALGSFDLVADIDRNGFFSEGDAVKDHYPTGFVLSQSGHSGAADGDYVFKAQLASDFRMYYRDTYSTTDDIYCWINPSTRFSISTLSIHASTVDKYIVKHKDAWESGNALIDVSSPNPESDTVQHGCTNEGRVLVWPAPLEEGDYDAIIDVNKNGVYDKGTDVLDGVNADCSSVGFTVRDLDKKGDWSVFIYLTSGTPGPSGLGGPLADNVNEIKQITDKETTNIVVQADSYDSPTTKRIVVSSAFDDLDTFQEFDACGEQNSGDPNVLKEFLRWGVEKYPANHYAVILSNHGNGVFHRSVDSADIEREGEAICWDDTTSDYIDILELKYALTEMVNTTGGKIDFLGFDACLMGMVEVAFEMSGYANIMVASEDVEQVAWNYLSFLPQLQLSPSGTSANSMAANILQEFSARNESNSLAYTLGYFDLSKISEFNTALDQFAGALIDNFDDYDGEIKDARETTNYFAKIEDHPEIVPRYDYRDFKQFAEEMEAHGNADISTASQNVITAYDALVLGFDRSDDYDQANGLSIWLPDADYFNKYVNNVYNRTKFSHSNRWLEFLTKLNTPE